MTKSNNKNTILYFIFALFAIIAVPIALNYLLPLTIPNVEIFGSVNTWFSFWSMYLGALMSGLITLFVLYKTLMQNQKNHITQIKHAVGLSNHQINYQTKLLEIQRKQKTLSEIKYQLNENIEVLDFEILLSVLKRISAYKLNTELIKEINERIVKIDLTQIKLAILFQNNFISNEQKNYRKYSFEVSKILYSYLSGNLNFLIEFEQLMIERNSMKDDMRDGLIEFSKSEFSKSEFIELEEMVVNAYSEGIKTINSTYESRRETYFQTKELMIQATVDLISSEEKVIENEVLKYASFEFNYPI